MNAPVHGLALGVTPEGPEAEPYAEHDPVSWVDDLGRRFGAKVVEVFTDCIEIQVDYHVGTHLVHAGEIRPIDTPRRTQ